MYVNTQDGLAKVFVYEWEIKTNSDHEDPYFIIQGRPDSESPFIKLGAYSDSVKACHIANSEMVIANLCGNDYTMPRD